jgi:hypothetical protein
MRLVSRETVSERLARVVIKRPKRADVLEQEAHELLQFGHFPIGPQRQDVLKAIEFAQIPLSQTMISSVSLKGITQSLDLSKFVTDRS